MSSPKLCHRPERDRGQLQPAAAAAAVGHGARSGRRRRGRRRGHAAMSTGPRSVDRLAQDPRQLLEGDPVALDPDPVALVAAERQRRVALPEPGVEVGRGAGDRGQRRRPVVDQVECRPRPRRSCRSSGSVPENLPSSTSRSVPVSVMCTRDRLAGPRERAPLRRPAVHHPERLGHSVVGQRGVERRDGYAGGQLGVDPVDRASWAWRRYDVPTRLSPDQCQASASGSARSSSVASAWSCRRRPRAARRTTRAAGAAPRCRSWGRRVRPGGAG